MCEKAFTQNCSTAQNQNSMKLLIVGLLVLAYFANFCSSVDRGKFIQCNQSGFCRRNRDLKPNQSKHSVVPSSIRVQNDGKVSMELTNMHDENKVRTFETVTPKLPLFATDL